MKTATNAGRSVARVDAKTPQKTPAAEKETQGLALTDLDLAKVQSLAALSRRPAVIAAALGVTRSAFLDLLKADPAASEAYETGRDLARDAYLQRLERSAFDRKGKCRNVTLAIWLGKIAHGFTETSGQQSPVPVTRITFNMPAPASMDEFRKSVTVEVPNVPGK